MDWLAEFPGDSQLCLHANTALPAIQGKDYQRAAQRQVLTVVLLPNVTAEGHAKRSQRMPVNDRREYGAALAQERRCRPASGAEPLVADGRVWVPVGGGEVDHGYTGGMDSAVKRPWYRLHWVTWVVIGLVIWSLVTAIRHPGLGLHAGSSGGFISTTPYGWPADHLTVFESGSIFPRPNERPELKYRWHYRELAFNTAFCLVLVVATVHVIELWLRSPNRMQLTLASLLGLTAVAACLAGLASDTIDFSIPWVRVRSSWLINWYGMRDPLYWPLILALGCTIYSLGWLALALLHRAYRLTRP